MTYKFVDPNKVRVFAVPVIYAKSRFPSLELISGLEIIVRKSCEAINNLHQFQRSSIDEKLHFLKIGIDLMKGTQNPSWATMAFNTTVSSKFRAFPRDPSAKPRAVSALDDHDRPYLRQRRLEALSPRYNVIEGP